MPKIRRAAAAITDLDSIWNYIAIENHNPDAADNLLDNTNDVVRLIALQPDIGRAVDELAPGCRRVVLRGQYLIYFRAVDDGVEIVRVLSGERHIHPGYFEP